MNRWARAKDEEQIANAPDDLFDLAPASGVPAATTTANWAAVLPNQTVPLIWERRHADQQEQ